MRAKDENKTILNLYLDKEVHAELDKLATEEMRSKANFSIVLLTIAVKNYKALLAAEAQRKKDESCF